MKNRTYDYDNGETAEFCGSCAAPLLQAMGCPECGTLNPPEQQLCGSSAYPLVARAVSQMINELTR
jgi:hypothetical protein